MTIQIVSSANACSLVYTFCDVIIDICCHHIGSFCDYRDDVTYLRICISAFPIVLNIVERCVGLHLSNAFLTSNKTTSALFF